MGRLAEPVTALGVGCRDYAGRATATAGEPDFRVGAACLSDRPRPTASVSLPMGWSDHRRLEEVRAPRALGRCCRP